MIVLPAAAAGLALGIAAHPDRWWVPVSRRGRGGFLLAIWMVFPAGMGLGDAEFALLLGGVLGLSVIPAMGVAFAAGALWASR